jgi:hypothetical protein
MIVFMLPLLASAYSNSDTATYAYGDEDTFGTGIANAAAVESSGECRVYADSSTFQTVAVAGLFGYDNFGGSQTWTITIQVVLLNSNHEEIESLTVWERDCISVNSRSFNGVQINECDTFAATSNARYFGVWIYASVSWGATICQDSQHTGSGYPAVLTVNSISWSNS